jgi:AcrR family transcriptional regulator
VNKLADTRNKILEKAFGLFIDKGFTDVSLNELSESVGISKAGFYHYFKSKDELLEEVIKKYFFSYFDEMIEKVSTYPGSPGDKLRLFILSYAKCKDNFVCQVNGEKIDFRSFYLLIMEGIKKYDFFSERRLYILNSVREIIKDILNEGKDIGTIRKDIDISNVTNQIMVCCEGIVMLQIINPDEDIKLIANNSFNYIYNTISTEK